MKSRSDITSKRKHFLGKKFQSLGVQGKKLEQFNWNTFVFWCTNVHTPQSIFRKILCTLEICAPYMLTRYPGSAHTFLGGTKAT